MQINRNALIRKEMNGFTQCPAISIADFCPEIPVSLGHSVLVIFSLGGFYFQGE